RSLATSPKSFNRSGVAVYEDDEVGVLGSAADDVISTPRPEEVGRVSLRRTKTRSTHARQRRAGSGEVGGFAGAASLVLSGSKHDKRHANRWLACLLTFKTP